MYKCEVRNYLIKSHQNERDSNIVQVWDCIVENDLKELISSIYINKKHLLFDSLSLKNFIVKYVWLRVVMEWVTFWKLSRKVLSEDKAYWKVLY